MLLNFIKVDFRTKILVDKYLELISVGVKPSEILVLVQNSTLKKQFSDQVLEKINVNAIEKLNIHSFFSIVYNTLIENWCFIENAIPSDKHFILPNLVGLEVSQFLLKDILKKVDVKGYNSKKSLLHQIFRRYSLIVQNNLTNEEVKERSKILKESFAEDAEIIIKRLLSSTLKNRSLDYLRQTLIFNHVYKHTDYFKNIKYLLVDDADEMTPVCFDFIKCLKPQLKDWIICFDSLGSSRCGYLSADTSIEFKLKEVFGEEVISDYKKLKSFSPHPNPLLKGAGATIVGFCAESENLIENAKKKIQNKGCDFLIANDISRKDIGFNSDENEVYILDKNLNIKHIEKNTKQNIAKRILEEIFE